MCISLVLDQRSTVVICLSTIKVVTWILRNNARLTILEAEFFKNDEMLFTESEVDVAVAS